MSPFKLSVRRKCEAHLLTLNYRTQCSIHKKLDRNNKFSNNKFFCEGHKKKYSGLYVKLSEQKGYGKKG